MRIFLICLAVTGLVLTVVGAVNTVGVLILLGLSAMAGAVLMTALALPSTLRGRRDPTGE